MGYTMTKKEINAMLWLPETVEELLKEVPKKRIAGDDYDPDLPPTRYEDRPMAEKADICQWAIMNRIDIVDRMTKIAKGEFEYITKTGNHVLLDSSDDRVNCLEAQICEKDRWQLRDTFQKEDMAPRAIFGDAFYLVTEDMLYQIRDRLSKQGGGSEREELEVLGAMKDSLAEDMETLEIYKTAAPEDLVVNA